MGSDKCENRGLHVDMVVNSLQSGFGVNSVRVIGYLYCDKARNLVSM